MFSWVNFKQNLKGIKRFSENTIVNITVNRKCPSNFPRPPLWKDSQSETQSPSIRGRFLTLQKPIELSTSKIDTEPKILNRELWSEDSTHSSNLTIVSETTVTPEDESLSISEVGCPLMFLLTPF